MKRREFLKSGTAAGVGAALPAVAFLRPGAQSSMAEAQTPGAQMLTAQMMWCAQPVEVPLKKDGPAAGIASSSGGRAPLVTPDLHVVFAKEFTLEQAPAKATIQLFAYTRYRLYINGVYYGRGPSRYQNQRPEYDTRDIAAVLRSGRNVVAVLVHRDAPTGRIMHHDPGFAAVISVGEVSGEKHIATDPTWRARAELSFGPRDEAWASIEEHIDARKAIELNDGALAVADWAPSVAVGGPEFFPIWPRTTPLQLEKTRAWIGEAKRFPVALEIGKALVLELPEIVQGYHDLELDADDGSELDVEYLLPGDAHSGTNTYTARGGVQRYMGGDTFAHNRLSLRLKSGRATVMRAESVEVRYPLERVGTFECSDPLLTKLWTICARSLELMSEDSYVDCADRERVEWTDDSPPAFDCTRVMMRGPDDGERQYWGDNRLLKGLLRRIALTQTPDGQIKAHSCSERWDIHAIMEDRSCDWVVLLREYYESSGDGELVRELWPALTRLMRWFLDKRTKRGLVLAREWEVWDNPLRYQVCEGAGLNALVFRALRDAAWLGDRVGRDADARGFNADANRLAADFNSLLWNAAAGAYDGALFGPGSETREQLNGKMFPGPIVDGRYQPTAQAALFALYAGIVPAQRLDALRAWLLKHLDAITGPMSHYYLFRALYGMEEEAHDAKVLDCMRKGWKAQVDSPWQTTWEDLTDTGGSKAHMYGMAPGSFLTTHALGVRRVGLVADRSIAIEPRCGDLSWAKGIAVTEFGPVPMKWAKGADGAVTLEFKLPGNAAGRLRLYAREGKDEIAINGRRQKARVKGRFVEVNLEAGEHSIRYPA